MRRGKRVSNALHTPCNISLESNMTSPLALSHMVLNTWSFSGLRGLRRDLFVSFMLDSSWTLVCITIYWHFQLLLHSHLLALEATPIINYWNRAFSLVNVWIPGAWLSENILHGPYSAFDTLFSSLLIEGFYLSFIFRNFFLRIHNSVMISSIIKMGKTTAATTTTVWSK